MLVDQTCMIAAKLPFVRKIALTQLIITVHAHVLKLTFVNYGVKTVVVYYTVV